MNQQENKATVEPPEFDLVGWIMAYEGGDMDEAETVAGFQHLINTGLVWKLQGHYGRTAVALIEAGYCDPT